MGRGEGRSGSRGVVGGAAIREGKAIDTSVWWKVPLKANNAGRSKRPGAKIISMRDLFHSPHKAFFFSGQTGEFTMRSHLPAVCSWLQWELRGFCRCIRVQLPDSGFLREQGHLEVQRYFWPVCIFFANAELLIQPGLLPLQTVKQSNLLLLCYLAQLSGVLFF